MQRLLLIASLGLGLASVPAPAHAGAPATAIQAPRARRFLGRLPVTRAERRRLVSLVPPGALNPPATTTYYRSHGLDSVNALVVERDGDQAFVTLREQARTPLKTRIFAGLPGGRSFTMSESFGGSLEAKDGAVESIATNLRKEASEELGIDADQFEIHDLFRGVAVTPDRSLEVTNGMLLAARRPVQLDQAELQEAASGEVAETGARALERVPFRRAVRYLSTGQIVDARAGLLLLQGAIKLGIRLPASLVRAPSAAERRRLAADFDPERSDVAPSDYSIFDATPVRGSTAGQREQFRVRRFDTRFASADGSKERRVQLQVVQAPDQVSELPLVTWRGRTYVGLVPSASAGMMQRARPSIRGRASGGVSPAVVQLRGLVRDVAGYRKVGGAAGGNLGVAPIYDAGDAHRALAGLGLNAGAQVENLGQFNASVGGNGFHMNLVTRRYANPRGRDPRQLGDGRIQFVSLEQAVAQATEAPASIDQMTQLHILLLATRSGLLDR